MNATAQDTALASGLAAISRGWSVFPLTDDKVPFSGTHGHLDATTDPDTFTAAMAKHRATSYGIRTGAGSNIVVIEVDPRNGGLETLAKLKRELGPLPPTPTVISGGGGRHFYFAHPGGHVPSRAGALGRGVDVKADGGYVVGPGSRHPSGRTYQWDAAAHPDAVPLPPAPPVHATAQRAPIPSADGDRRIPEGNRNGWLTSRAGYLRRAGFGQAAIAAALLEENAARCSPPLPERDVEKIAASVARYPAGDLSLPAVRLGEAEPDPCAPDKDAVADWRAKWAEEHRLRLEAERERDELRGTLARREEQRQLDQRVREAKHVQPEKDLIVTLGWIHENARDIDPTVKRPDGKVIIHRDGDGYVRVRRGDLAAKTGKSPRTITGQLKTLKALGVADIKHEPERLIDPETGEVETVPDSTVIYFRPAGDDAREMHHRALAVTAEERQAATGKEHGHGGKREPRCDEHPDAGTIVRTVTVCAAPGCERVLDRSETHVPAGDPLVNLSTNRTGLRKRVAPSSPLVKIARGVPAEPPWLAAAMGGVP